jgi:arginyl-tRNA synthetase
MLTIIKHDLSLIGVSHDIFFSEKSLHDKGAIEKAVKILENADLIYRGKLDPPKGKIPEDWEDREQLLFKSTKFSDDMDRPLQKSNGEWTYFAADLAYAQDKIDRGFSNITMVLGADHGGYVKRIKASISALSDNKVNCNIQISQLVNYYKNGLPFKMSKRSGNFITLQDVVDAVGKDVIRFIMLTRKNDIVMDFDLEKVTEQSKDNPVFYVQYAHARIKSILANSQEMFPDSLSIINEKNYDLSLLSTDEDISLIKTLGSWPRIVEQASIHQEPHRIAYYLNDLAALFHSFWSMGRENKNLRFLIPENKNLSIARVSMVIATANVIANGLNIFNIAPIDEM